MEKGSSGAHNYLANDREVLELNYYLEIIYCEHVGLQFENIADNGTLKHFFDKINLNRTKKLDRHVGNFWNTSNQSEAWKDSCSWTYAFIDSK